MSIANYSNNHQKIQQEVESNMLREPIIKVICDIIRDNAKTVHGHYQLFASDLPRYDKRLLLSYLVVPEDFEEFTKTASLEEQAFDEYESEMQYLINQNIWNVWHEDMQSCGLNKYQDQQTGEIYYSR